MSQLTDFLFIGLFAVGGMAIFFNWKDVSACLNNLEGCLGGGGSGQSGNCVYNQAKHEYTWQGTYTRCVNGANKQLTANISISCPTCASVSEGCDQARSKFLSTPGLENIPCTGGGGGCTKTCTGGYIKNNSPCSCVCNNQVKGCTASNTCLHATPTTCGCFTAGTNNVGNASGCVAGQYRCRLTNGQCGCCKLPTTGGNCSAGQQWIARVAVAILNRMCGGQCANPFAPTISQVASGWSSLTNQLAKENCNCNTTGLNKQYSTFCKNFALLLGSIVQAYKLKITLSSSQAITRQAGNGVWQFSGVDGGVPSLPACFSGYTEATPDTPYGFAYSTTLDEKGENAYDPDGDQRYSRTLNVDRVRVKVAG